MPQHEITDLSDPRLEPFLGIRNRNWTEQSGLFIAEGPLLVEQLLASDYACKSVLLDRKFEKRFASMLDERAEALLVDHAMVEQIVGFDFHRGVIGCGIRKPLLSVRVDQAWSDFPLESNEVLVAMAGIQDPENLGGILRSCAALGIRRVLIGPDTADPLSRRALRVSMGTALKLELLRSRDLAADLRWLTESHGVESYAAILDDESLSLEQVQRHGPAVLLFGNERYGVPESVQAAADHKVRIDMDLGTDSLNVCVAAGIIMHYFCRLAKRK